MTVDPTPHLIVPFAQCSGDDWLTTAASLDLKNLSQLLRAMKVIDTDTGLADSLSPPHERVLAKALGLPANADGLIPWAALDAKAEPGQAWAVVTPCHWAMGREHATLVDPEALEVSEADSRALLTAMQPYFATEGITLHYTQPTRWLAEGEVFRSLATASLDRVLGRNVDKWLPNSKAIKLLQNEMQMLLYTHRVNDERAARGKRSVNSFWVSGSGALTALAPPHLQSHPQPRSQRALAQAAFANDWTAYDEAWTRLDSSDVAQLLTQQRSGKIVRLSLCGESKAVTFETTAHGLLTKLKNVLSPQRTFDMLKQL